MFSLETSAGRVRVRASRVVGKARCGMVAPCNEAQRGQAAREPRNRARSGLTRWVKAIEDSVLGIHEAARGHFRGQLRFWENRAATA